MESTSEPSSSVIDQLKRDRIFLEFLSFLYSLLENQFRMMLYGSLSLDTFSKFLDPSFSPEQFTTTLLESKSPSEQGIDSATAQQMFVMYLDTLEGELKKLIDDNKVQLFDELRVLKSVKEDFSSIMSKVNSITQRFKVLKEEIEIPYCKIQEQASLLTKYQNASKLLRNIQTFKFGIKKLKAYMQDTNPNTKIWLKTSKAYLDTLELANNPDFQCMRFLFIRLGRYQYITGGSAMVEGCEGGIRSNCDK